MLADRLKKLIKALKEEKQYYEKCRHWAFERFKCDDDDMINYIDLRMYDAKLAMIYHILDLVELYELDSETGEK